MAPKIQPVLADAPTRREQIRQKTVEGLSDIFPIVGRGTLLEASNIQVKSKDYSTNQQKDALMRGRTLHEPVVGTLILRDKKTGEILDKKTNHTLAHIPYFTERHSFIVGGNEYDLPNQLRLKAGVYTRERGNGEFEAAFNLSKGSNFRIAMEPESGKLHMELGTSKIPLYPILKSLGIPDTDIRNFWGPELKDINATGTQAKEDAVITKIINKIKRKGDIIPPTLEGKRDYIRDYFEGTEMDPEVNVRTLGVPVNKANGLALLHASKKLIDVHRGQAEEDDRDSLEFKTIHSVDDFFKERLDKDAKRTVARKLEMKMNQAREKRIDSFVPNSTFTKSLNSFITKASLSSIPTQTNPVEILDHAARVTSLGEGGISSERSVPFLSRKVHNSHLGILDPVRIPECCDKETEVLTRDGWKYWPEVTYNDYLACRIAGRLEFHQPTHLTAQKYTGTLYGVKTGKIEYLVTPNHRVLCKPYESRGNIQWRISRADEVHERTRVFDSGHEPLLGENHHYFTLPFVTGPLNTVNVGPINMDDWAEFMGWFLSEGTCVYNENKSNYFVHIAQSKAANPDCCEKIEDLLRRLPFKWHYNKSCGSYIIGVKQLASHLSVFGKSHEKYIPDYLLSSPISSRERLLESLLLGDGRTILKSRGKEYVQRVYCTTSVKLARDVERLAIGLGWATKTRRYVDKRNPKYLDVFEVRLYKDRFRVAFPKKKHFFTVEYDDFVYCAEVPGSLLYVRRNGSVPIWTGNSFKAGIDIRASIAASRDDKGNLYSRMIDAKTGKETQVPATVLARSVVAFSGQEHRKGKVDAIRGKDVVSVPRSEVDYIVPDPTYMFSASTALVPFIDGIQGNRTLMGSKFQTQALPLVDREAPLVQSAAPRKGQSMEMEVARLIAPTAPVSGTVTKVDADYIYITPDKDHKTAAPSTLKVPYDHNYPLASKTYLHNDVRVKAGDKVKQDQILADSNFTKDDTLALGKNLSVGYMAYYGKNSNDAVVISESASKKLTSEHMYKKVQQKGTDVVLGKDKYVAYYGTQYTGEQLSKLDANGVAKPGVTLKYGDPIILGMRKAPPSPEAALLGHFHKSLVKPYRDMAVTWDKLVEGEVVDVVDAARQIMVTVRTREPMKVGDKLSNRFGGKGVVGEIVNDEQMVKDEGGKPIDVLFTSAGIVSRVNPAQVVEASLGKVADKIGKPLIIPQFMREDNVQYAKKLLKEHGLKDKETVYDPVSGKHIPDIFVGKSYIHKLFKSTETNYAARGVSDYDVNLQPTRGGEGGAKGIGKMEINALLAHNARNVLKEDLTTKGEKNDEFWRAFEFGYPPPPPKTPFVSEKFVSMLQGAGINVDKSGSQLTLGPMTDQHVEKVTAGALAVPSLEKSKSFMVSAKNLKPERGGLFDPVLTGGLSGTKWSHMDLSEPIVNPIFEEPVRRLLGMTKQQLKDEIGREGGKGIQKKLNSIDLDAKEKELLAQTKTKRGSELDNAVKQLKYIRALKEQGYKKAGDAYVLSKVPVIPPVMRPILPSNRGGELQVSDINYLYRDVGLASEALRGVSELGLPSATSDARKHLHDATSALFGISPPVSPQLRDRAKGFVEQITGSGSPKSGFLHKKILKRQQDLSGRATATPDLALNIDQIGIPEDMVWETYSKFIMKGLIHQGYKPATASQMVEERHPAAKNILDIEIKKRPVFVNRAPSLHKHNFVAAYPVPVAGKSLRVNPFMERGQNLDYDGDTMQIHVPISDKAVQEAQGLTLSSLLFSDKSADDLMVFPQHEAIMGAFVGSAKVDSGKPKVFKSKADAVAAYNRGEIKLSTPIKITGKSK